MTNVEAHAAHLAALRVRKVDGQPYRARRGLLLHGLPLFLLSQVLLPQPRLFLELLALLLLLLQMVGRGPVLPLFLGGVRTSPATVHGRVRPPPAAQDSARRRADITTTEKASATAEELALRRKTALAEARAAAASAERASEGATQETGRVLEGLQQARAEGVKMHGGEKQQSRRGGRRPPPPSCGDKVDVIGHHSSSDEANAGDHLRSCRDELRAADRLRSLFGPFRRSGRPFGPAPAALVQRGDRHGTPPEVW